MSRFLSHLGVSDGRGLASNTVVLDAAGTLSAVPPRWPLPWGSEGPSSTSPLPSTAAEVSSSVGGRPPPKSESKGEGEGSAGS